MEDHIVLIDDNKLLCNAIAEQVDRRYGEKYVVDRFYDARSALEYIREDIDQDGDRLVMVGTDERMGGMQGHELLRELKKSHPRAKKFIFSAWSDTEALISGINTQVDGFVSKASTEEAGDPLFDLIRRLIDEYEADPRIEYTANGITFKQADTLHEKQEFLRKRFRIYLDAGHKSTESLRAEELDNQMECDEYDPGGIEAMILTPQTRYILALKEGLCIGGARIIDGKCPLETGICLANGFGFKKGETFHLNHLRNNGVYTREISRLIVDKNYRKSDATVLMGLLKMIEQLTNERNHLFCTSKEKQIRLYKAIGFEVIGPKIRYALEGEWIPMMRDRWKAIHSPNTIPGMVESFHLIGMEPIPENDQEKWIEYSRVVNEEAINRGFYINE